jgi:hypothetical protein
MEKTEKLGETSFSIILPKGYCLTEDESLEEDQIAYYYKDDNSIDFDVYAWSKENYVLKDEAEFFATEYNSTATEVSVNGNDGYVYISKENYDDKLWTVYNYLFEDDKFILEIAFWTDGSEKEIADVNAILATLIKE